VLHVGAVPGPLTDVINISHLIDCLQCRSSETLALQPPMLKSAVPGREVQRNGSSEENPRAPT